MQQELGPGLGTGFGIGIGREVRCEPRPIQIVNAFVFDAHTAHCSNRCFPCIIDVLPAEARRWIRKIRYHSAARPSQKTSMVHGIWPKYSY